MPWLLRMGLSFWPALAAGCILTVASHNFTLEVAPRLGLRLRTLSGRVIRVLRLCHPADANG